MVDQDERRALILQQIKDLAAQNGGEAEINEDLLEEVNYLVEWPTALCGKFEEKFLRLPKECIITPMRGAGRGRQFAEQVYYRAQRRQRTP